MCDKSPTNEHTVVYGYWLCSWSVSADELYINLTEEDKLGVQGLRFK